MTKRRKVLLLLAGGFMAICLLSASLFFSAASILQTDAVQKQVVGVFQRVTGARLTYGSVEIGILPLPQLTLHDVDFEMPGLTRGQVGAVTVQPELMPLLKGTVRLSQINLTSPAFIIELTKTAETAITIDSLQQQAAALVRQLTTALPGLEVEIEGGRLNFKDKNSLAFSINDFNLSLALSAEQLEVEGECTAEPWQLLSFSFALHPEDMSGSGFLQLSRFSPSALPELSRLIPGLQIVEGEVDLKSSIEVEGINQARMSVEGSMDGITLARGERKLTLGDIGFRSTLALDPKTFSAQLQETTLDGPLPKLSGTYQYELATGVRQFTLQGVAINIPELRQAALALGADLPTIQSVSEILQAGDIPALTIRSTGMSFAELIHPDHLELTGDLVQGTVSIPGLNMTFLDVAGKVEISKKILSASGVEASLDNHRCRQGDLQIGLYGEGAPFYADLEVEADVGQLPDLLKRSKLLPESTLRQEIDRLQEVQGKVVGHLRLGEGLDELKVQLALARMEFSLRSKALPFPLVITGGKLILDEQGLQVTEVAGTLGNSVFSGVAAKIGMAESYAFTFDRGKAVVVVAELYPWLSSLEAMKPVFNKVRTAAGTLAVSSLRITGPLLKPGDWRYTLEGEARKFFLDAAFLPGNIESLTGSFRAIQDTLSFQHVSARVADSTLALSGELVMSAGNLHKASLSLQGDIGPQLGAWFAQSAPLPQAMKLREPITIQESSSLWEKGKSTSIRGTLHLAGKIIVSGELIKKDGEVSVRDLQIKDSTSDALASISFGKEEVSGSFKGRLVGQTLDAILAENPFIGGSLHGDFRLLVPVSDFLHSTLAGTVTVRDMPIPWKRNLPLVVQEITLEGAEKKVNIVASRVLLGGQKLSVRGTFAPAVPTVEVDLDVEAEVLDWGVMKGLTSASASGKRTDRSWLDDLPVRGVVRVRADTFQLGRYAWIPLHADISVHEGIVNIATKKAIMCGISTHGTLAVSADGVEADIVLSAKDIAFEPTALCLTDQKLDITGTFALDAHLTSKGAVDTIADSLQGPIMISAKNGQILRSNLMSKTLALIKSTDKFRNELPDTERGAITYSDITVAGTIQGPVLSLKSGTLVSNFVDMSANGQINLRDGSLQLKALVAPLRTMDRIVKGTPLLGRVLGGNLTALPVIIDGNVKDLKVNFLSPAAIGTELLGVIERTVKLPVIIAEPVFPAQQGNKNQGR